MIWIIFVYEKYRDREGSLTFHQILHSCLMHSMTLIRSQYRYQILKNEINI